MPDKVKLMICEDRESDLEYFVEKLGLYSDIQVVGGVTNPEELLLKLGECQPDVILFDLRYDAWDQQDAVYEVIAAALRQAPMLHFLGFTAYRDLISDAKKAGCEGVIYKGPGATVKLVHDRIIALGHRRPRRQITWNTIGATPAEVEAFQTFIRMGSIDEAAAARSLSRHTEKGQLVSLREKLAAYTGYRVDSMPKAISIAVKLGLIDLADFDDSKKRLNST